MLRVDTWTQSLFQTVYDALWDAFAVRIGSFRLLVALAPVAVDWCLQIVHSRPAPSVFGTCLFLAAIWMVYDPFTMLEDNRRQARGAFASLNAVSHGFAQRTLATRLFYLCLFAAMVIVLRDVGGFALISVVYARCIKVRARREREVELRLQPGGARP